MRAVYIAHLAGVRQPYTILGVVPPRFTWNDADIYIPMSVTPDPKRFVALMTHVKKGLVPGLRRPSRLSRGRTRVGKGWADTPAAFE